jgi:hypothetical protein
MAMRNRVVTHPRRAGRAAGAALALVVTVGAGALVTRTALAQGAPAQAAVVAAAAPVTAEVTNGDFEAQPLPNGFTSYGSPAGWAGGFAVLNPNGTAYSGLGRATTTGAMRGPNVLTLFEQPGQAVAQTTATTVVPGVTYRLTVAVGDRDNADVFGGATVTLLAGGVPVQDLTVGTPPVQGGFGDVTVTWTAGQAEAGLRLGVRLGQAAGDGKGRYADFDNVRLAAEGAGDPATGLVLSSPVTRQVVQRGDGGLGVVPVRGVAPAGDTVQARLVLRAGSGGRGTDWRPLPAGAAAAGTFAGDLTGVPAGWYDLQVRLLAADGTELTGAGTTVQRVGVGEVFVAAGQSNSANHGRQPQLPVSDRVSAPTLGFGAWQQAADPQPNATGVLGSPWPAFGDHLTGDTGLPVAIVSVGYGGTTLAQWQPGGTLYDRLQLAIASLGPRGFRAVLWHQGESDAKVCTSTARYAVALKALIAASRRDAGFTVPWGIASASTLPTNRPVCEQAVRAGQAQVRQSTAATFAGPDTDGYRAAGLTWDTVHFNDTGLRRHGAAWAAAVERWGGLPA